MCKKSLETTHKIGWKNKLGPDKNPYLDQIITLKNPKLEPDNNLYMLLSPFAAPQNAQFGPFPRVHLRPPEKKKKTLGSAERSIVGAEQGFIWGPPKSSFEAPQNLVWKGPFLGGRKWTHGGPQMNASNSRFFTVNSHFGKCRNPYFCSVKSLWRGLAPKWSRKTSAEKGLGWNTVYEKRAPWGAANEL